MPTKDGFDPAHPLPRFLADQAEQGVGNARDGAATASQAFKASILIAAAAAIGIAVLALGNPAALFADVSSLAGNSSPQPAPTIQSVADAPALIPAPAEAQDLPPATRDAAAHGEIAASEPAGKDQRSEPTSETLFRQFQAWAAEQDAKARGGLVQPAQDDPAEVVQNVPAPAAENARVPSRLVQKRQRVRAARNARAEMRTQDRRKRVRRVQGARAERPPVQAERPPVRDARAQDPSVQNAQAPSFLPFLGLRN